MRDERTAISILDADLLPERDVDTCSIFHLVRSLEVRSIFGDCAEETGQALELFRSKVICTPKLAAVSLQRKCEEHTKSTDIHNAGTDADEEHTVFLVLRAVLGHDDIQSSFECRVQSGHLDIVRVDKLEIGVTTGKGDDLLLVALQDQREEEVVKMNVSDDVGLIQVCKNPLQLLNLVGSACR